jgi:UDPglucose 6-dehydrogenase
VTLCFVGNSHAPRTLAVAALSNGFEITHNPKEAALVFVSEDTPTDQAGQRDLDPIRRLVLETAATTKAPIVLTSQVPPGFTRSLGMPNIVHMAETLRIKDAMQRAKNPEQFIVGVDNPQAYALPWALMTYMERHQASVHVMSWEEAEFSKIAINMFLAAQVDCTNRLAAAAAEVGARWDSVCAALKSDRRIGEHAYLTPGRWEDSSHLMRDYCTLKEILAR